MTKTPVIGLLAAFFSFVFCMSSIEHGTREKSNWQTNLTLIHLSVPLIDKEWGTQGKASETATFLFISADSNVTGINTALMHSPHALSFHWTPRLQSQPDQRSHSGALVATVIKQSISILKQRRKHIVGVSLTSYSQSCLKKKSCL